MKRFAMVLALLALAACANPAVKGTESIKAANTRFEEAFNAADAEGIAALYTADAVLMAPNYERIRGRRAIQGLWQRFFDAGVSDFDINTVELDVGERRASEYGTFSLTAPDGKGGRLTSTGKYIVLWRRDRDGVWRLHRDIWNNDPAN
jgi:uncharacterized protein (TIGR02246 family)